MVPFHLPPPRQQLAHPRLTEAVIQQPEHALILRAADHPAGGLHHLLQTGKQVGIVVTVAEQLVHAGADLFGNRVDLGQPQGGNEGADQPLAGRSMPSPKAPPSTANPTCRLSPVKLSRKALRAASSMPADCTCSGMPGQCDCSSSTTCSR